MSVVQLTRFALPHIIKEKGTVVNVSSINGPCPVRALLINDLPRSLFQFPNVTYYCMSKAALDQFTKCLALEMAPKGVRVNSVKWESLDVPIIYFKFSPGVTKSKFHLNSGMNPEQYAQFLERSATTHALGRYAEPEEVRLLGNVKFELKFAVILIKICIKSCCLKFSEKIDSIWKLIWINETKKIQVAEAVLFLATERSSFTVRQFYSF